MTTNYKEFGFKILPFYGNVRAEIFTIVKSLLGADIETKVISKEFGSYFRGANESDYIKARAWVDLQMKYILKANQ